ncbi:MAG: hypothetical protein ABGY29_03080 [bacterium]
MADPTIHQWADAIADRIVDEGPWADANERLAALVRRALLEWPDRLDSLKGTMLIEDDHFLQTRTVTCKTCGGSIALVGLTEERNALGQPSTFFRKS